MDIFRGGHSLPILPPRGGHFQPTCEEKEVNSRNEVKDTASQQVMEGLWATTKPLAISLNKMGSLVTLSNLFYIFYCLGKPF